MVVKLVKAPDPRYIYGCKNYSGAASGDLVKTDAKIAAIGDRPLGVIVDELPTDNPPKMLDAYGEGSWISGLIGVGTVGVPVFSDGDGTMSTSEPAGAAGTLVWIIGYIVGDEDGSTSDIIEIKMSPYEKGA